MITNSDAYKIHSDAWLKPDSLKILSNLYRDLMKLFAAKKNDEVLINNIGAVLLDLQENVSALNWLVEHPCSINEYHQNLAIAYAKTNHRKIEKIRKHNEIAASLPKNRFAIIAYIDYQGL